MAKVNWIPFIVFLLVAIECGVSQFIFDDQESFIEPTKYVDQKVKNLLLLKFASIDYELGRTLNNMKKQITNDLESKLLLNVNNRISKMEDEIRVMKEKCSLKENNEQELITNITDTLDSKINFSFKEMGLSINVSYNSLDEKMSKLTKNLKIKLDRSESKVAELGNNVSILHSEFEDKLKTSLESQRMKIIKSENVLQETYAFAVNNSVRMIQQLETYFNEKLSSSLTNITNLIQITNDRVDLESYNNSVTLSSFEQKMRDLQTEEKELITNITETLDSKINAKFLETSLTMNKSFALVEKKMSSLAESMKVKIDRSESKIAEIGQNVSILHSNFQEAFNNSLASIRMEIITKGENLQISVLMAVNNSLRMIQQLEAHFNDQLSLYVENFTKMIQISDKRAELESYNNNSTMLLLEQKINTLQKEKVNLEDEIMTAKTNLSVLKRQGIVERQAIQYQLNENYKEVSTWMNDTRKDQEKMFHVFANNLSDVVALGLQLSLVNDSFYHKTTAIQKQFQNVIQNVSNISAEIKQLELKTVLDIKNLGTETNKTAEQVLRFEIDLNSCKRQIEGLEKYQNVLKVQNNITFEQMRLIEGNMSIWNGQLQTAINLNNDVKAQKNNTILEFNRVMLNISNIRNTIRDFETYHANQNSRLGTIERRQTNISSTLSDLRNSLNYVGMGLIRLENGGSTYGRVELFYNGAWGTVCDDSWDSNDAYVACRMLGLSGGTPKSSAYYGQGSGSIWLDDLQCSGSESSLFACIHPAVGSHNCGHGEDAGVICS